VSAATIKKELATLRAAWHWAQRHLDLAEEFPGTDALGFGKIVEPLPFLTWEEAEARVAAGDDPAEVWDCVYLRPEQVAELLAWVRHRPKMHRCGRPLSAVIYPMFVFAAHTGARLSEIVRAIPSDVDLAGGEFTIREKKRDRSKLTTRRVPLSPLLREVLGDWLAQRCGQGRRLFCRPGGSDITPYRMMIYFRRCLHPSKWRVLRGWHVLRHSFIFALASRGVDQRIIDDLVGRQTEEQRRRYRHLYPDVKAKAVADVFG
jgi:integrase